MTSRPGWYPSTLVSFPPSLPPSFENVYALKPIVGAPTDEEVIAIHTVMHAANRVSGVPGVHSPSFYMELADHLFNVQMARYRSRYSLITFPSDATYTPPVLPSHVSIKLESVSGAPSDDEIIKVQDTIQTYQELRRFPSLFDAHVNMELSQHLFDLQMARHMRTASEVGSNFISHPVAGPENVAQTVPHTLKAATREPISTTINLGAGPSAIDIHQTLQPAPGVDIRELMERSNNLAERFNQLLERSNELIELYSRPPTDLPNSQIIAEGFGQVFERLGRLVEQIHQPVLRPDRVTEHFNPARERPNADKFAETNRLTDREIRGARKFNQAFSQSSDLSEQFIKPVERLGDLLQNTNRVLAGIQHAIVRNRKGNTVNAIDSLINEKGEFPGLMDPLNRSTIKQLSETFKYQPKHNCPVTINGVPQYCCIPDIWLGDFVGFYGIGNGVCENATSSIIIPGKEEKARKRLSDYLTSCLG